MIIMNLKTKIRLGIYAILIGALTLTYAKNKALGSQVEAINKEMIYYMDRNTDKMGDIAVLELNTARLRHSNDLLVRKVDSLANELKIKANRPGTTISYVEVAIETRDTIYIPRPDSTICEFQAEIKPNDLTRYFIEYKNDTLIHEANINNEQTLFVYPNRVYLNSYRTFIGRLLRLDFKKTDITRYQIHNTNDVIKVIDSSVILVKE